MQSSEVGIPQRVSGEGLQTGREPRGEIRIASAYGQGFAAVAAIYCLVLGIFLAVNHGLPYVFDNNETFSALVHAANLYHFGWARGFGLPDETLSFAAAAGPYLYTHGGNFPRLFAYLLYALGARSPEAQIVITTFTVGLAGVLLAYHFFARAIGPLFAFVFGAFLITDYVMVTQWLAVTWHAWQSFFVFGTLVCVANLDGERPTRWLALIAVSFLCLFYYDLIFAIFVAVLAASYAIYVLRGDVRRLALTWIAQGAGAVAGAGIFVAQVVAMFGWPTFLSDVKFTYGARNEALSDPSFMQQMGRFFSGHHIVFWYNFINAGYLRDPFQMLRAFFYYNMSVYSPVLVLGVLLVTGFAAIGCWTARRSVRGFPRAAAKSVQTLLVVSFIVFAMGVLASASFADVPISTHLGIARYLGILAATVVVIVLVALLVQRLDDLSRAGRLEQNRILLAMAGFLLAAAVFIDWQRVLYDGDLIPLWQEWDESWGMPLLQICIIGTAWFVLRVALAARHYDWRRYAPAFILLLCGAAAYVTVAILSPGYVITTAFQRYVPLTVFVHAAPFALATTICFDLTRRLWWTIVSAGRPNRGSIQAEAAVPCLVGGLSIVFLVGYWSMVQATYAVRLPGDRFAFLQQLRRPPFKGATFVANTYAAPIAVMTGNWAYFDPLALHDEVTVTDKGYALSRDRRYLWFADRDRNPTYLRPQYFVCMTPEDLRAAVPRVDKAARLPWGKCSDYGAVDAARSGNPSIFHFREVASAGTDADQWSILAVDWHTPPSLQRVGTGPWFVKASAIPMPDSIHIDAVYRLSNDETEKGATQARLHLYQVGCSATISRTLLATTLDSASVTVPSSFQGILQVGVEASDSHGRGAEYFSNPVVIGGAVPMPRYCERALSRTVAILPSAMLDDQKKANPQ